MAVVDISVDVSSDDKRRSSSDNKDSSSLSATTLQDDGKPRVLPVEATPVGDASSDESEKTPPAAVASAPPPPEATRTRLQTAVIMLSLCSAMFLSALDVTIVTVAIPTIAGDFNSTIGYTWIGSAYLLASAAAAPSWGKFSDIWGRRQVLLIAVAVFWVGSLLSATSVSMAMLIAARAIQGIGSGGIVILVNVCISDLFSIRKRGFYFGLTGLVWAFAGGVGPVLGGVFTTYASWRWCFYINLPVAGVGFAVLLFVLRLHNPRTGLREGLAAVDWFGSLTIVGGTLMILMGLTLGDAVFPWRSPAVVCLLVLGVVVIGFFFVIERYFARYPVIPLRLFRHRVALAAYGTCFFHGLVFISGTYYLPLYFQAVLGASPLMSGVYVLPFSIVISATSASVGFSIRKTGNYQVFIVAGFVLLTLGIGLFTDLGAQVRWGKCIVIQIIAALGIGCNFQSPLIALQTTVQPRDIASATATFGFIRQLATSISVVVGGVVFESGMQTQHAALVASIGENAAGLLTGSSAAASVYLIEDLDSTALAAARLAYWKSLRNMYILYTALAAVGLVVCLFIRQTTLSKTHEEHKTGLQTMQEEKKGRGETNGKRKTGDVEQGVLESS